MNWKKMERSSDYNCGNLFCFVVFFLLKRHREVKDGLQEFLVVKSELWNWQVWVYIMALSHPLLTHWMILSKCLNHMDAQFKSEDNLSERDISKTERVKACKVCSTGPGSQPVLSKTLSVTMGVFIDWSSDEQRLNSSNVSGSVILQYYIVYVLPDGKFPSPLMRWNKRGIRYVLDLGKGAVQIAGICPYWKRHVRKIRGHCRNR